MRASKYCQSLPYLHFILDERCCLSMFVVMHSKAGIPDQGIQMEKETFKNVTLPYILMVTTQLHALSHIADIQQHLGQILLHVSHVFLLQLLAWDR